MMWEHSLLEQAKKARGQAYAPYSGFKVGAALLCQNGQIYTGCNIENASYSATNCAERTAFYKAISEGEREFKAMALIGGPKDIAVSELGFCYPCGVCRQVMLELCRPDEFIIIVAQQEELRTHTLSELVPYHFSAGDLNNHTQGGN